LGGWVEEESEESVGDELIDGSIEVDDEEEVEEESEAEVVADGSEKPNEEAISLYNSSASFSLASNT
jgi:hypothetical protein